MHIFTAKDFPVHIYLQSSILHHSLFHSIPTNMYGILEKENTKSKHVCFSCIFHIIKYRYNIISKACLMCENKWLIINWLFDGPKFQGLFKHYRISFLLIKNRHLHINLDILIRNKTSMLALLLQHKQRHRTTWIPTPGA